MNFHSLEDVAYPIHHGIFRTKKTLAIIPVLKTVLDEKLGGIIDDAFSACMYLRNKNSAYPHTTYRESTVDNRPLFLEQNTRSLPSLHHYTSKFSFKLFFFRMLSKSHDASH